MNIKKLIQWKLFFILLAGAELAAIAVLPYVLEMQKEVLAKAPVSLAGIVAVSIMQSLILMAIVIFLGLLMMPYTGLQMPLLSEWVTDKKLSPAGYGRLMLGSVITGGVTGIVIVMADLAFMTAGIKIQPGNKSIALWKALLASLYGGIGEEVLLRLFLMTLIAFIIMKVRQAEKGHLDKSTAWVALSAAAVFFAVLHLPVLYTITEVTTGLIIRTVLLNMIGGIVFGWLYWKKGLEFAMIAHFTADIVLHVLAPLII